MRERNVPETAVQGCVAPEPFIGWRRPFESDRAHGLSKPINTALSKVGLGGWEPMLVALGGRHVRSRAVAA
jgi:hypothetical protein